VFRRPTVLALIADVAVAATVRRCRLGSIPPGMLCDEASNGYDAY
jgi:hypothetical protein